jgi:protein O-mannosyl-transferase
MAWLVAIIALLAWAPASRWAFVWDDDIVLLSNPRFNPPTWNSFVYYWAHPFWNLYTPLPAMVYGLVAKLSFAAASGNQQAQLQPILFHPANILFHAVAAAALYFVLWRVLRHSIAAACGAILFAVHPIQTEAVAFIGALNNPMCGAFSLIALCGYLKWVDPSRADENSPRRQSAILWGTSALIAAILSKPTAVVIPPIAILLDWAAYGRGWRATIRSALPWIAIVVPFAVATALIQHGSAVGGPVWFRFFVAGDAAAFYLAKIVFPWNLAVDYGRSPASLHQHLWAYFIWLVPAGILLIAWMLRRRTNLLIAGVGIFLIALLPNSGVLPFDFQEWSTTADRYVYLPMIGSALIFGWAAKRFGTAAAITVLLILIILQQRQLSFWRDEETLFQRTVAINPRSWWSWGNLSHYYLTEHRYADAANSAQHSLDLHPNSVVGWENLGLALTALGRYPQASAAFQNGVYFDPGNPNALLNCADSLRRAHQWDESIRIYTVLLHEHPEIKVARQGLDLAKSRIDTGP